MRVLISGGEKTINIIDTMRRRFSAGSVDFTIMKRLDEIDEFISKGDLFDKAILIEPAWMNSEDNRLQARGELTNFIDKSVEKYKYAEMIFVATDEDMARIVLEETFDIRNKSRVILKEPPYAAAFFSTLITSDLDKIPEGLLYTEEQAEELEDKIYNESAADIKWSIDNDLGNAEEIDTVNKPKELEIDIKTDDEKEVYEPESGISIDSFGDEFGDDEFEEEADEDIDVSISSNNVNNKVDIKRVKLRENGTGNTGIEAIKEPEQQVKPDNKKQKEEAHKHEKKAKKRISLFGFGKKNKAEEAREESDESDGVQEGDIKETEAEDNIEDEASLFEDETEVIEEDEASLFEKSIGNTGEDTDGFEDSKEEENIFNGNIDGIEEIDISGEDTYDDIDDIGGNMESFEDKQPIGNNNMSDDIVINDEMLISAFDDNIEMANTDDSIDIANQNEQTLNGISSNNKQQVKKGGNIKQDKPEKKEKRRFSLFGGRKKDKNINKKESNKVKQKNNTIENVDGTVEEISNSTGVNPGYTVDNVENGVNGYGEGNSRENDRSSYKVDDIISNEEDGAVIDDDLAAAFGSDMYTEDDTSDLEDLDEEERKKIRKQNELAGIIEGDQYSVTGVSKESVNAGTTFRGQKGIASKKKKNRGLVNNKRVIDDTELRMIMNTFLSRGCTLAVTGGVNVGKTTVAYNLANMAAKMGYSVLLVDMDTSTRGLAYMNKDIYEVVHQVDTELASVKAAINNCNAGIDRNANIVRPGFHVVTCGLAADLEKATNMVDTSKLSRFMNTARTTYNFVILDIPFDEATTTLRDMTFASDYVINVVEANNHGLMSFLLNMANIEDEEMQDFMFNKSKICFNKVYKLETVFGIKISTIGDILIRLDDELEDLIGDSAEYLFREMKTCGILNLSPTYEQHWFSDVQVSDTVDGEKMFVDMWKDILIAL